MNAMFWVLLAGAGLAAASELLKRRKVQDLKDISDEEFIRTYKEKFGGPTAMVIEERRRIAKHITIPHQKLSPDQRFDELSKYTGFVGEYEVGMGDLESVLEELCERAALSKPSPFPATVGAYIYEAAKARQKLTGDNP